MSDPIIIALPLPPDKLHPNKRYNRMGKYRLAKQYKETAYLVACGGRRPKWETATVRCAFYFKTNRRRDQDNAIAWMKAGFDGIAAAGVVANDSGFRHQEPAFKVDKDNPRVEVTIRGTDRPDRGGGRCCMNR